MIETGSKKKLMIATETWQLLLVCRYRLASSACMFKCFKTENIVDIYFFRMYQRLHWLHTHGHCRLAAHHS
jgi:hypothetical protein